MASVRSSPWQTGGLALAGCTNVHFVTITVPSAGTVVVTSAVHFWVDHVTGTGSLWFALNSEVGAADCNTADPNHVLYVGTVGAGWSSEFLNVGGTTVGEFPVGGAGTYTYYVNAQMYFGESAGDAIAAAQTVAVFYPS